MLTYFACVTKPLKEDVRVENKENQWMGVTVQSQGPGGKIVVSETDHPPQRSHSHSFQLCSYRLWVKLRCTFCNFRLVPIAIRGARLWTRLWSTGTSRGAVTFWARTWPSTRSPTRTEVTGTSARADPEATRCSDLANKVWLPPLPRTTITWCLEHRERTTGKVTN